MAEICPRAGRLFGCKFEGRFDLSVPTAMEIKGGTMAGQIAFLEASKAETYVRDVCVRCGKVIERASARTTTVGVVRSAQPGPQARAAR